MKNMMRIFLTFAMVLIIKALIINPVSAQTTEKSAAVGKPIPENVMKIAEKSCLNCHFEPGNGMALSRVNFTKWGEYSPEKQASKANAIYKEVSKNKMPPKNFRKNHPDSIPNKDEIQAINDWALSLQVPKK